MAQDLQAQQHGSTAQGSGGHAAGARNHHAKIARHRAQLKGQGAVTGGLATSPGAPKVSNRAGRFYAKGKR